MTHARNLAAAALSVLALAEGTLAQEPLVADRPDFTEGTSTVGVGVAHIEFGYTFGLDRADGTTANVHSLGEPLLRVGLLADWLEVRVGAGPVAQRTEQAGSRMNEAGLEDLYLGVKLSLSEQNGVIPALGILPQTTVPTGSEAFSDGEVLPGVNLMYAWDLTETFSLSGSTQANRAAGDSGSGYLEWAQSLSGGLGLGDRHGLYGEWFAIVHEESEGRWTEHYLDSGLTWLITDDLQWDIRAGFGLNESAEDLFFGTGLAVRLR